MQKRVVLRALAVLPLTGVVAGGSVYLGVVVSADVPGGGRNVGVAAALPGLLACVAAVAWAWSRIARRSVAVLAAISILPLWFLATALFISIAAIPYDALACADSGTEDFCVLGVVLWVPTFGCVVPWTVGGLPGMLAVLSERRNATVDASEQL